MPKAYSYVRFSTPEQAQGDSLRRQTEAAAQYARDYGLELDAELTFQDCGVSAFRGANAKVGALRAFLKGLEDGLIENGAYLLVESLDRISRDQMFDAQVAFTSIIQAGAIIVTLKDGKVYSRQTINANPMDMIFSLLVLIRANEESATKSARLTAVYEAKRKAARAPHREKPFTRRTPAWIEWNDANKAFQLIPARAAIVQTIFERADGGLGKQAIASRLNADNVKPFGRAKFWHKSYIGKVLENPACIGIFIPKRKEETQDQKVLKVAEEPIPGYFPAVVSQDLWERVSARQASAAPRGRHSGNAVTSIVAGVARCGLCGSSYVKVSKGKYTYLVCSRANSKAGCEYLAVPYQQIESTLIEHVPALVADAPKGGDTGELETQIAALDAELDRLQSDGQFLTDEFRRTRSPTLSAQIAALDDELRAVKEQLSEKRKQRDAQSSKYVAARLEALTAAFQAEPFDVAKANDALKVCVSALEFNPKTPRIEAQWATGSWAAEGVPLHTRHLDSSGFDT